MTARMQQRCAISPVDLTGDGSVETNSDADAHVSELETRRGKI